MIWALVMLASFHPVPRKLDPSSKILPDRVAETEVAGNLCRYALGSRDSEIQGCFLSASKNGTQPKFDCGDAEQFKVDC